MQQRLSPKGSTLREVKDYYTLLDSYIKILMSWSQEKPIDPADRKKAENLRQRLLLGQARMVSLLGDPTYSQFGTVASAWNGLQEYQHCYRGSLLTSLKILKDAILVGMGELRNEGIRASYVATAKPPKAFIAHGGQSACLKKLCAFLKALGVDPVVAEWSESEGRWTEEHVDKLMEESDCYIVLAEYGNIVDLKTGAKHPRLNVIDELARSREKRSDRIVLLLQKGVSLPSNVSGIVYEHFTKQNMEKAFIKVAKELRSFGLIRAMKG